MQYESVLKSCRHVTRNVENNQILLTMMCSDIVIAANYISESSSNLTNVNFVDYIQSVYKVLINTRMREDLKTELNNFKDLTTCEGFAKLLKLVIKFKHIAQPTALYKIIRIIDRFNIEHGQDIKAKYYIEMMNKETRKKQRNETEEIEKVENVEEPKTSEKVEEVKKVEEDDDGFRHPKQRRYNRKDKKNTKKNNKNKRYHK